MLVFPDILIDIIELCPHNTHGGYQKTVLFDHVVLPLFDHSFPTIFIPLLNHRSKYQNDCIEPVVISI